MQIATNSQGKVVLVGDALPTDWNGLTLTVYDITLEQEAEYNALPSDRAGATFDGNSFAIVEKSQSELASEANALIIAQLEANDAKIIRALVEGDTERISAHAVIQAALREKLLR